MSEDIHRRIVEFLSREFARAEGRQCILLELTPAQPGMRGDPIRTWDRREQPEIFDGLANIESMATEICKLAEEHAESFGGGSHRFEVRTSQHLGGRQKTSFRIRVESDADQAGGEDAPTATGLVGQLMRHNEIHMRTNAATYQVTLGVMSRTIQDLADENARMRRDRADHLNELEEARSRQAERDLEGLRQINADNRKEGVINKITGLLPLVANRMLGGGDPSAAGAGAAMSILASELADSLNQEQMIKIASTLSPNQQALLAELMRTAKETKAKSEASASAGQAGQAAAAG